LFVFSLKLDAILTFQPIELPHLIPRVTRLTNQSSRAKMAAAYQRIEHVMEL
jgi:hypothetical protein